MKHSSFMIKSQSLYNFAGLIAMLVCGQGSRAGCWFHPIALIHLYESDLAGISQSLVTGQWVTWRRGDKQSTPIHRSSGEQLEIINCRHPSCSSF